MIKHFFPGTDPDALSDEEYYRLADGALWLEERQANIMAKGISMAFGEK